MIANVLADDELPSLDEAIGSVDALVSDDAFDGFAQPDAEYQTATPSIPVPPGLGLVHGRASPTVAPPGPASRGPGPQPPITPTLSRAPPPGLPLRIATPELLQKRPDTPGSSDLTKSIRASVAAGRQAKVTSQNVQPEPSKEANLHDEDFPALATTSTQPSRDRTAPAPAPSPSRLSGSPVSRRDKSTPKPSAKASNNLHEETASAAKKDETRSITVNTQLSARSSPAPRGETSAGTEKSASVSNAAFPPLPVPSAAGASPSSSMTAPKTLRLVSGSRPEVPALASPASAASRAMSLSNIRPETPPSESISETASLVSASVSASRAGSPQPTRVGTAAVRATTKSQQRKQRKEALKQDTKLISEAPRPEPEEHAPVLGRKKKQKKEKPLKPATSKQPAASETTSDAKGAPKEPEKSGEELRTKTPAGNATAKSKRPDQNEAGDVRTETTSNADDNKKPDNDQPKVASDPESQEESGLADGGSPKDPELGPSTIFDEVKSSLWTSIVDQLQMLKPVTSGTARTGRSRNSGLANVASKDDDSRPCKDSTCKCGEIQDADLAALRAGKPVRKQFHVDGSRMLITPNGDCIRGLSAEEEDAFLELQRSIAADAEHPGSFVFQRHQPGNGAFSLIKGRAVPNGRPNIFPVSSQPQSQDPIGKLQREDALGYINQYVLPRLNLGATNMGLPKGATMRQDAAAASLNSLAPYFYGPDAAAGVGIYSAPESKDFAPPSATMGPPGIDGNRYTPSGVAAASAAGAGPGVSGMPLMSVEDAEVALSAARKETDKLEKRLNALIKSNKRVLVAGGN